MTTITIDEITRNWDDCLKRLKTGETLLVLDKNSPVAELKPVSEESNTNTTRPYGLAKGKIIIADDFDAPLPEDILQEFEGK